MENYGAVLKKLIKFTNVKLSTVADLAGYDVSYISKWCNQSALPSARVSSTINKNLSSVFASEIIAQNELENFCNEFNVIVTDNQLADFINNYLKESFKNTISSNGDKTQKNAELKSKILYNQSEILRFMEIEFPKIITDGSEPTEILCTMDICAMFSSLHSLPEEYQRNNPIRIRMGINLSTYNKKKYFDLYCMLNKYYNISFDIYDNSTFGNSNLIVVKDKVCVRQVKMLAKGPQKG